MPRTLIVMAAAGVAGVLCRYTVDQAIGTRVLNFPLGILVVNLSGAFLAGLLFAVVSTRPDFPEWARLGLFVGFLGAYTTFSTMSIDSLRLLQARAYWQAGFNSVGQAALGVGAAYLGLLAGRLVTR